MPFDILSFRAAEDLSSPLSVSLALCIGMRGGAAAAELGGRRCGGAEGVGGAGEGAARAAEEVTRARTRALPVTVHTARKKRLLTVRALPFLIQTSGQSLQKISNKSFDSPKIGRVFYL